MKKSLWIRILSLMLALGMLFTLSGCTILGREFEFRLPIISDLLIGAKKAENAQVETVDDVSYSGFADYITNHGYSNVVFKQSSVVDFAQQEVVGLCQNGDDWYGVVSVYENGEYRSLFCEKVNDMAFYLVEYEGKWYVMTYTQSISHGSDGVSTITNTFEIFRYNQAGEKEVLDQQTVSYDNNSVDATAISNFFAACNNHLAKGIVIADPYRLKGQMWLDFCEYGAIPNVSISQSQVQVPATEGEQLGFVQIKDPKSWLNLREGPGTNYPCVYMEPGNKKSIVKQAQGSPVTILETIETGDAKNPVWVKVRISYAGQEIVGYSSKTYIRTAAY